MSRPSALWPFLTTYALLYGAFGMQSPFVPTLLRERGLQAQDIGLVLAAAMVVRVLAGPVVAHAADRLRRHTLILCGCALFAALASISYLLTHSLAGLLCIALLHAAMLGPIAPISDALAATAAQASRFGTGRRFDYGWLRAAGSASFALGALVSGWRAGAAGLPAAMWTSGALLVMGSAVALSLPNPPLTRSPTTKPRATMLRDGVLLLRLPVYRRMLVAAALLEGSHALHDSFSVIRWRSAGIDFFTVSALWSESVFAEVVVFLLIGPWLVRRLGPSGSMALAAGAGVLRWTVAAFTTSLGLLACIQPLHGLTFALFHLAAIQLIVTVAPVRLAATARAIYGTLCVGLAIALLTFASGLLYARAGGETFLLMAALCLLALPICAGLRVHADPPAA
ncbi:MAG TPA: MFS transporter [Acetobacteraceae bacterium]|nr:MFS transporter [Acetobacteraceae bacterium]